MAYNWGNMASVMQETEDLELDPQIASKGVAALLKDPAKGRYFVLEVSGKAVSPVKSLDCWLGMLQDEQSSAQSALQRLQLLSQILLGTAQHARKHILTTSYILQEDGRIVAQLMITFEWSDWYALCLPCASSHIARRISASTVAMP